LQVNYGLLTDGRGCPVAVSVFDGNTSDSKTFLPQVQRVREQFGIQRMVMVGDRGMISQKAIDAMRVRMRASIGSQHCAAVRFAP
jgi:transposase